MFSLPNLLRSQNLLDDGFGRQESAGLGRGVFIRMLGVAVVGYSGGHTGAVGARGNGDIAASGGTECPRTGPSLHAMPDTVAVLLL